VLDTADIVRKAHCYANRDAATLLEILHQHGLILLTVAGADCVTKRTLCNAHAGRGALCVVSTCLHVRQTASAPDRRNKMDSKSLV
jgi:hypothetical protein